MARDLRLQVIMSAVDRIRRPLRQIRAAGGQTAEALRDTQRQVRELNKQQRDISGYRRTVIALRGNARALRDARDRHQQYTQALEQQRNAHANIRSNLATARRAYDQLARSMLDARQPSATLSTELEKARIRLASQQQAFDSSARSLRQYETQTRTANEQVKRLTDTHATSIERLNGLKRRLDEAGISTDNTTRSARQLRDRERELNTALEQQQRHLARVAEQQRQLNRTRGQYQQGRAAVGAIAGAGGRMLASGSIGGYAAARFLGVGAQFDTTMSRVQALARLDKDDPALAAIRAQARELGASTTFTSSQVADGQAFLAMAGFDPDAIRAAMPGLLDLARAGDMDLGATADISSNILTGMGLEADQMTRVADVMAGAFTRSNTTIASLGETMKYAAPSAAQFGVDLETATAMAAKLGDAGLQGSMGGTGIRRVLGRLAAPTGAARDALESLGAELDELDELGAGRDALERVGIQIVDPDTGGMRDTVEILREIYDYSRSLSDVEQGKMWKDIAGETGAGVLSILVEQAGTGGLEELREALHLAHENNEAATIARVMSDNWGGDWNQLKSAWQDVGQEVFEQLNDWLRETTQRITEIVRSVGNWMRENPRLTQTIGKIVIVGTALMTVLGGISLAIAGFLGPLVLARFLLAQVGIRFGLVSMLSRGLGSALMFVGKGAIGLLLGSLKMLGIGLLAVAKFIGGVLLGIKALGAIALAVGKGIMVSLLGALKAVALFLVTNPIGWLILAIGAGALYIWRNWETLGPRFAELWQGIQNAAAGAWASITAAVDDGTAGVLRLLLNWSPLGLLWDAMVGMAERLGIQVPELLQDVGTYVVDGLILGIRDGFASLRTAITELANGVIDWFKGILGINSPSRVFREFGINIVEGIIQGIGAMAGALRDTVMNMAGNIAGWMRDSIAGAWEAGQEVAAGFANGVRQRAGAAWDSAGEMANGTVRVVRERLRIRSPSRVFAELGRHTMDGYQRGLERNESGPLATVAAFARHLRQAGAGLALGTLGATAAAAPSAEPITLDAIEFDTRPPITASPDAGGINITIGDIHVHASPGMDEQALARFVAAEVQRALDRAARDAAARRRSAFHDLD